MKLFGLWDFQIMGYCLVLKTPETHFLVSLHVEVDEHLILFWRHLSVILSGDIWPASCGNHVCRTCGELWGKVLLELWINLFQLHSWNFEKCYEFDGWMANFRIIFDDLHKTGIFSWDYFYHLGSNKFSLMRSYMKTLKKHGLSRDPKGRKWRRHWSNYCMYLFWESNEGSNYTRCTLVDQQWKDWFIGMSIWITFSTCEF